MSNPNLSEQLVTIFGGSGFVGRYIARRFAKLGYRVRVAVRRPNEALFVRTYGVVGQVEPVQANLRDEASIIRAVDGASIVINATGILRENRFQSFDEMHHTGPEMIAKAAKAAGARQMIHLSAIGADSESDSKYAQSKAAGEAAVSAAFPKALIVRPSVVFGVEDEFFNQFGSVLRLAPIFPVPFAGARMQPVYVDDVAEFVERASAQSLSGVFELGGPKIYTMMELLEFTNQSTMRKRALIKMPNLLTSIFAYFWQFVEFITIGLIKNPFMTPDNMRMLAHDNIVEGKDGFAKVKIAPEALEPIAAQYLESYRPHGEFETLTHGQI